MSNTSAARYDRLVAALSDNALQSAYGMCPRAEDASTAAAEAATEAQRRQLLQEATAKSVRCAELIASSLEASAALAKLQQTLAKAAELGGSEDESMQSEDEQNEDQQTTLLLRDLVAAGDEAEDAAKQFAQLGVVRKTARASHELLAMAERDLMQLQHEAGEDAETAVQNEFRDLYMEEFTTAFGDELDQFRQEERFESKDVAYLISCIHAGGDIFSPLQKKLFVESVAASRME